MTMNPTFRRKLSQLATGHSEHQGDRLGGRIVHLPAGSEVETRFLPAGGSRVLAWGCGAWVMVDRSNLRAIKIPRCSIHPGRIGAMAYSYVKDEYIDPVEAKEDVDGPPDEICCPPCARSRHGIEAGFEDRPTPS